MPMEYAENKIEEALKQAGGNATRARQQIIAWCYEDSKLLHELTKSHLTGIVAYNVERVQSGRHKTKPEVVRNTPDVPDMQDEELGMEILRAVAADDAVVFGHENNGLPQLKRGKASKQHMDAIKLIASKSKTPQK